MSTDSPAVILFDELGNPVGVTYDGYVYRLQVETKGAPSTIPTDTVIAVSITNVTLLTSNTSRLGASIFNNSQTNLFVKLGSVATTDSYTAKLIPGAYYEVPYNYTGRIDGIWDSSSAGDAQVTELI